MAHDTENPRGTQRRSRLRRERAASPGRAARLRLLGLAVAALTVAATACGDSDPDAESPGTAGGGGGAAFPVTIEHEFGSTTIESEPTRVVTLGYTDTDAVLALGVTPVLQQQWIGSFEQGVGPWATDRLGSPEPELIPTETTDIPFEQVAAAEPDVIIAVYRQLEPTDYDKLAAIAPTVAVPEGVDPYGVSMREQTEIIGRALGKADEATQLVDDVEAQIADAAAAHPEFAGTTAAIVGLAPDGGFYAYTEQDPRIQLLSGLGFELPAELVELSSDDGFSVELSAEKLEVVDGDLLIVFDQFGQGAPDAPLFSALNVVERGDVVTASEEVTNAFSHNSVLSVPYVLDDLVAQLAGKLA